MIEEWLESLRSKSTKGVYTSGIKDFTSSVLMEEDFNTAIVEYVSQLKTGYDPFKDLLTYATSLTNRNKPPKTAKVYMYGVLSFLEYAVDYEMTRKQSKQLRNKMPNGKRARTIEDDLTREKLQKILTHCDTKGKALFLFLESSGIRVGEALQLELDELNLESELVKVNVRAEYTKTGDPYYSFISKEAKTALVEWLKIRDDYLLTSAKRGKGLRKFKKDGRGEKPIEDERIFPFSPYVASSMWNIALRKAKFSRRDKGTKRRTLHIHMLRKFFSSQLRIVVPRPIVEALMGHEEGLDDAYKRYSETQIREWYLKGEAHLYVFVPQELAKIQTEVTSGLMKTQLLVNDLTFENRKLRGEVDELKKTVEDLSRDMQGKIDLAVQLAFKNLFKEDREAIKELQKWREEFTKRYKEETKD